MLTQDELCQFDSEGYLILRQFFGSAEVARLREAMVAVLGQVKRGTKGIGFDVWTSEPGDRLNPHRVTYLNDIFLLHPVLDEHMRSERLGEVFAELYDADVYAFQSATVVKPPDFNFEYLGWHQDAPDYVPLSNYKLSSAITYLSDTGPDSGGTSVVPRSHKLGLFERGYVEEPGWPVKRRVIVGFEEFEEQVVSPEFSAGDVMLFHPCLMHCANSNFTDESKIGLINAYRAADCIDMTERNTFRADNIPIYTRKTASESNAHEVDD